MLSRNTGKPRVKRNGKASPLEAVPPVSDSADTDGYYWTVKMVPVSDGPRKQFKLAPARNHPLRDRLRWFHFTSVLALMKHLESPGWKRSGTRLDKVQLTERGFNAVMFTSHAAGEAAEADDYRRRPIDRMKSKRLE